MPVKKQGMWPLISLSTYFPFTLEFHCIHDLLLLVVFSLHFFFCVLHNFTNDWVLVLWRLISVSGRIILHDRCEKNCIGLDWQSNVAIKACDFPFSTDKFTTNYRNYMPKRREMNKKSRQRADMRRNKAAKTCLKEYVNLNLGVCLCFRQIKRKKHTEFAICSQEKFRRHKHSICRKNSNALAQQQANERIKTETIIAHKSRAI